MISERRTTLIVFVVSVSEFISHFQSCILIFHFHLNCLVTYFHELFRSDDQYRLNLKIQFFYFRK